MKEAEAMLATDVVGVLAEADGFEQQGDLAATIDCLCSAYTALLNVDPGRARGVEDRIRSLLPGLGSDGLRDLLELDHGQRLAAVKYVELAQSYLQAQSLRAAEDACLNAIEQVPEYIPIQTLLSEVFVLQGETERAIEKYRCVIDLYLARNNKREAIDVLRLSLKVDPDDEKRRRLIAWMVDEGLIDRALDEVAIVARAHLEREERDGALSLYDQMVKQAPDNALVHLHYGRMLEELGRMEDATGHYVRSWELEPRRLESTWRAVKGKLVEGEIDGLEPILDALLELILPAFDESAAVVEGLRSSIGCSPHGAVARLCLSLVLARIGEWQDAEAQLRSALAEPTNHGESERVVERLLPVARLQIARAMLDHEELGQAIDVLVGGFALVRDRFVEGHLAEAHMREYLTTLRDTYERKEDAHGTLWLVREMKTLLPGDKGLGLDLARLYFEVGQIQSGLTELLEVAAERRRDGDPEAEFGLLLEARRRVPDDLEIDALICEALIGMGRIEDAAQELESLAEKQEEIGKRSEAAESFRRSLNLARDPDPWVAQAVRERILSLDPDDCACRVRAAERYLWTGQATNALMFALEAARGSLDRGDLASAGEALRLVVKIDPWNAWAHERLGELLRSMETGTEG